MCKLRWARGGARSASIEFELSAERRGVATAARLVVESADDAEATLASERAGPFERGDERALRNCRDVISSQRSDGGPDRDIGGSVREILHAGQDGSLP